MLEKLDGDTHKNEPYTKTVSKWMKDLNVRQETIKILLEKTCSNFLSHSNFLLDMCPKAREIKADALSLLISILVMVAKGVDHRLWSKSRSVFHPGGRGYIQIHPKHVD